MDRYKAQRMGMVALLQHRYGIADTAVLDAMADVPREEFVLSSMKEEAYDDATLPIQERQTISQPYIVALTLQAAQLSSQSGVLDVGTGSGYAAAVASRIVQHVYTIERHKHMSLTEQERFRRLGYTNITSCYGDGIAGWKEHAPYDAIIVGAAADDIPIQLLEQLAVDGILIIPVADITGSQRLIAVQDGSDGQLHTTELEFVRFVPLLGGFD